ncbi:hypothetical protein BDW02DRAFT_227156 [Decorospora gaudefroyi]|uniref:DUF6604 domain-containing protein n=1 Tax=Decorospora gaudefroyi TaxID=184978 RepID=A0A6A5K227_9PLEO|nr:hypothetical protein BDW02DRAFT_227156 [Decorospora gaudefroyi]
MTIYDQPYDFFGQHETYTSDTKIALNEIISQARASAVNDRWEVVTGFPEATPIKELPTRAFMLSAKLLAHANTVRAPPGCLSRLSKLALDRAISDRKQQAYFYKIISTRTPEEKRIYEAHIYFIQVLEYIRYSVLHLFVQPDPNEVQTQKTSAIEVDYSYLLLLCLKDQDNSTEPNSPPDADKDADDKVASLLFWKPIHEFLDEVLAF